MNKMGTLFLVSLLFRTVGCAQNKPAEWEHGWKTAHVIATRYSNQVVGFNVGFRFPLNPNECDDSRLFKFMESNGGWVYEAGGYPGAEMFVVFQDVKDKGGANRKLQAILPKLEALVKHIRK